jgi:hypothetical protein
MKKTHRISLMKSLLSQTHRAKQNFNIALAWSSFYANLICIPWKPRSWIKTGIFLWESWIKTGIFLWEQKDWEYCIIGIARQHKAATTSSYTHSTTTATLKHTPKHSFTHAITHYNMLRHRMERYICEI